MKKLAGVASLICMMGIIFLSGICQAKEGVYESGETARAFHDTVIGSPWFYQADIKPDFSRRFSEIAYEKKAYWKWGPVCQIHTKALRKCLYEVSAEVDREFPDVLMHNVLKWAFHCLTAVVEESYQPSSYNEVEKVFKDLWKLINDSWIENSPGSNVPLQLTAFSIKISASSNGNKHKLIMQLPQAWRAERLKKLGEYQQELDEIRERFPVLRKNISPPELLYGGLVDFVSLERYAELRAKIFLLSEEIKREHEKEKK